MRGKKILLTVLVLVLSVAMLGPVGAPVTNTKIKVEPSLITGMPGESVLVFINVEDVTDLYAVGFTLSYAPFSKVLAFVNVMDGGFLQPNPYLTKKVDSFWGKIQVGMTLIGAQPGCSGSGTIAIIEFIVLEAGECSLDLSDTVLLDSNLAPILHNTFNGYYLGPTVNLVRKEVLPGRDMHVCQTASFISSVKNLATVPLYVRVRFDMIRDDGKEFRFYAGQSAAKAYPNEYDVYLYVNSFNWNRAQWTEVGTDPFLDAPGDGSYVWDTINGHQERWFGFEDLTLSQGESILSVALEGYTDGPYDEGNDFDTYGPGFGWLGSLYSEGYPAWVSPRWTTDLVTDVYPELTGPDPTNLNNFSVLLYFYTGDGKPRPPALVDCVRLKVTILPISPITPPEFIVEPNKVLELPPFTWGLSEDEIGKYDCTATCEYKYYLNIPGNPDWWLEGQKVSTFTWWCDP